ncbi:MAG: phosphoglyceromutase, partial [Phaeodactylibacter sp.]|nr:phosphoglyceromutase [Phaeodactylibacter sp.]
MLRYLTLFFLLTIVTVRPQAQPMGQQTENVFIITLDGMRWQELYGGAVDSLMTDPEYVKDTAQLLALFDAPTPEERRKKLMPWFWSTLAQTGQLYGNRWLGNKVDVTNFFWFSYPGYNEILTGYSDPRINSNSKIWNPNVTVLEWINRKPEYNGRVAAFGSWDV